MRRKRRSASTYRIDRRWLFGAIGMLALLSVAINCTLDAAPPAGQGEPGPVSTLALEEPQLQPQEETGPARNETMVLSDELWADVTDTVPTPRPAHDTPDRISLNVKDANLLDVLSMLAYKLDCNIIFIEEPTTLTIKTVSLSPLTTFQLILQKEGFDYLSIGRNYIVGNRDRLYADFTNRMFLSRYELFYVSASDMEGYIDQLGMPVESLSVDSNQQALWMQGTPMTLGKARELINTLDVMENASFAEGGARKIRMPVATATGNRAEEELEALIDLLSILLDGFRDGRTDMGWVTWDHPDPVPYIYMEWESPIIKPYDIMMKVTRDFANNANGQIRYLIAEGSPDNIELVNQMIAAIAGTPNTPFTFQPEEEEAEPVGNDTVQWIPDTQQSTSRQSYSVAVKGVPADGGSLAGGGSYSEGTSVTVTAEPSAGYEFVRWIENGAEVSTSRSYTFAVYASRSLEAVFTGSSGDDEAGPGSEDPAPEDEQD